MLFQTVPSSLLAPFLANQHAALNEKTVDFVWRLGLDHLILQWFSQLQKDMRRSNPEDTRVHDFDEKNFEKRGRRDARTIIK